MENNLLDIIKCRICLDDINTSEEYYPFFDLTEDVFVLAITLVDVFEDLTGLKVIRRDEEPNNICSSCTNIIIDFNNLLIKFQKTEACLDRIRQDSYEEIKIIKDDLEEQLETKGVGIEDHLKTNSIDVVIKHELLNNVKEDLLKVFDDNEEINTEEEGDLNLTAHTADRVIQETQNELFLESSKFTCKLCDDVYLMKSGFRAHMFQRHNIHLKEDEFLTFMSKVEFKVPKGFPEIASLPNSINNSNHRCRLCKETFETAKCLKEHLEIHKTYTCEQCGAGFIKKCYLTDHLITHSTERRYECKRCGKKFKSRSTLLAHNRCHLNARIYTCEICGTGFKGKSTLTVHKRLKHTDERNYHCKICDLKFKLRSVLNRHIIRRHTQRTKRFVCDFCGIAYLNKNNLQSHISYKHSGKVTPKYSCSVCDKTFGQRGYVNKHMRNVHKIKIYSVSR